MSKPKGIFLIAQYTQKPKEGVNTSVRGWMENPNNIRWDERVEISRGLRTRDMHAQVILDLTQRRVEQNSFNGTRDFDTVFKYFLNNYSEYIARVMSQLDPDYLRKLADDMEQELKAMPADTAEQDEKVQAE